MTNETATEQPIVYAEREDGTLIAVDRDTYRHTEVPPAETPGRIGPFFAGVLATLAAGAVALFVFLAVSSADDDGNIELDVPAVDVNIGE